MKAADFLARIQDPTLTSLATEIKPLHQTMTFFVPVSRAELWPLIADSARFNRALGLPNWEQREESGRVVMKNSVFGLQNEWVEEPWSWVAGESIVIRRHFRRGVAHYFATSYHLTDAPSGTNLEVYTTWIPRNSLWRSVLQLGGLVVKRKYKAVMDRIADTIIQNRQNTALSSSLLEQAEALCEQVLQTMESAKAEMVKKGIEESIVGKLYELIKKGDPLDLYRLRLIPLARQWKVDLQKLLRTCLYATKESILNISWDTICPHCRGVRTQTSSLSDVKSRGSCEVCKNDFETDKIDSIEVSFHIHPSVREVPEVIYCAAEPSKKEHIRVQQVIPPQSKLSINVRLREGEHRLRVIGRNEVVRLTVKDVGGLREMKWSGGRSLEILEVASDFQVELNNPWNEHMVFVLEELWWQRDALKPIHLFSCEEFRPLFPKEILATDVRLSLGEQTILFTDIVGSTKFYETNGDARAFREVKRHFDEIFPEVSKFKGVVVKTIGDSVMAAFPSPEAAMNASLAIQGRFRADRKDMPIRIRISTHVGQVLAVHLDTGIDYFGGTVNYAAKLQACAGAGEIALSKQVFEMLRKKPGGAKSMMFTSPGKTEPSEVIVVDTSKSLVAVA